MKTLLSLAIVATLLGSNAMAAEGGYLWEKNAEAKIIKEINHKAPTAAGAMGHTAVEHKRWLVDDAEKDITDKKQALHKKHSMPSHGKHMASDHKRMVFGSNN